MESTNQQIQQIQQKSTKSQKKQSKKDTEEITELRNVENMEQKIENDFKTVQQLDLQTFKSLTMEQKIELMQKAKLNNVKKEKNDKKLSVLFSEKIINYEKHKLIFKIQAQNCLQYFTTVLPDLKEKFDLHQFSKTTNIQFQVFLKQQVDIKNELFEKVKNRQNLDQIILDDNLQPEISKLCYFLSIYVSDLKKEQNIKYDVFDGTELKGVLQQLFLILETESYNICTNENYKKQVFISSFKLNQMNKQIE